MRAAALIFAAMLSFAPAAYCQQAAPDPLAACGDDKSEFSVERGPIGDTKPPASDKARVYIVELYNLHDTGRFLRPTVRQGLDGQWIGATQGFTYVSADVDPGVHHLCSRWQSHFETLTQQVSLNNFEAVAGKQYYFRVQIVVPGSPEGTGVPSIDLQAISEDEGRFLISQAALSVSKQKK
jgi:hypothetical protein